MGGGMGGRIWPKASLPAPGEGTWREWGLRLAAASGLRSRRVAGGATRGQAPGGGKAGTPQPFPAGDQSRACARSVGRLWGPRRRAGGG